MIDKLEFDRLDEVLEEFEENWSLASRDEMRTFLRRFELAEDQEAVSELIRVDMDFRYREGLTVQLDEYLSEFGDLLDQTEYLSEIAFEDYRLRTQHGHSVSLSRWNELPGVSKSRWYRKLYRTQFRDRPEEIIVDPALEKAAANIGFRIVSCLGAGAFSEVYLATQSELSDRYVVLKVVEEAVEEPQKMAMLQHTNIVPIFSFHQLGNRSIICMPYNGRVTLNDFILRAGKAKVRGGASLVETIRKKVDKSIARRQSGKRGSLLGRAMDPAADENAVLLPLEKLQGMSCNDLALWMFQRVATGLAHSHARQVLHGDIKPKNILVRNDGEPSLLDFNLSQDLASKNLEQVGGTVPYMAPEIYRGLMGQEVQPSEASDIYSLGVVMYEFVTGRHPYPYTESLAPTDLESMIKARRNPVAWEVDDKVSVGTKSIVQRCLEFQPEDRYPSAEALQVDLDREFRNERLLVAKDSWVNRGKKWVKRHPKFASGGTVGIALAIAMIPLVLWAAFQMQRSKSLAAAEHVRSFKKQSVGAMVEWMADPQRRGKPALDSLKKPMAQFVSLGAGEESDVDLSYLDESARKEYDQAIWQYVGNVAFAELTYLRTQADRSAPDQNSLTFLDQLIEYSQALPQAERSRSLKFIRSHRASLAGDTEIAETLRAQANAAGFDSQSEAYLEIVRLLVDRERQTAIEMLISLAQNETIQPSLRWTMLGRTQFDSKQYEQAKVSFTHSIETDPDNGRLWHMRGLCFQLLGQTDFAIADFTQALRLEPDMTFALSNRGRLYLTKDHFDPAKAVSDFTAALDSNPTHVGLLLARSAAYRSAKEFKKAQADLEAALASDNVTSKSLVARGKAKLRLKDYEGAKTDLRSAIELNKTNIEAYDRLVVVYERMGDDPGAAEVLTEWIEADPGNEKPLIERAVKYARLNRKELAFADLEKAIVEPNSSLVWYQAACTCALLGDTERAMKYLPNAIIQPEAQFRMGHDEDLTSLHSLAGFKEMLGVYRKAKLYQPDN